MMSRTRARAIAGEWMRYAATFDGKDVTLPVSARLNRASRALSRGDRARLAWKVLTT